MADAQTFTHPAEIAGIQEANTAVLPSGMPLNDLLMKAGQFQMAHAEAKKQAQEQAIQDRLKMFNIDTVGVWNEGMPAIEKYKQDGLKQFYNTDFLKKYDSGDLGALQQYQQWKDGLNSQITNEKLAAEYYKQKKDQLKDPNYQVLDESGNNPNQLALDKWAKQGSHNLSDAPDFQYQTPYNAMIPQQIAANIKPRSGTLEVPNKNGSTTTITADFVPTEDVVKGISQYYGGNQQNMNGLTTAYITLHNNYLNELQQNPNAQEPQVGIYAKTDANGKVIYAQPTKVKDPTTGVYVIQTLPFETKKLSEVNGMDLSIAQGMESLNQQYKQTQTNAPQSNSNGSGTTNSSVNYQDGGTMTFKTKSGEYQDVGYKGGWNFGATAQKPSNINIPMPAYYINGETGESVKADKSTITGDIIGIHDYFIDPKRVGADGLPHIIPEQNLSDKEKENQPTKRLAEIHDENGNTILIPFTQYLYDAIHNSKIPTDISLSGGSTTTTTQSSGTQQQGGVKTDFRKKYNY